MNSPIPNTEPTSDDLAGIPACLNEHSAVVKRPPQMRSTAGKKIYEAPVSTLEHLAPTANDLAGVPISADGIEDLTIRPRKARK